MAKKQWYNFDFDFLTIFCLFCKFENAIGRGEVYFTLFSFTLTNLACLIITLFQQNFFSHLSLAGHNWVRAEQELN